MHIVFILHCQKVQTTAKLSAETSIVLIIFNGVLYHVLYWICFSLLLCMHQVPEKDNYITLKFIVTQNHTIAG